MTSNLDFEIRYEHQRAGRQEKQEEEEVEEERDVQAQK